MAKLDIMFETRKNKIRHNKLGKRNKAGTKALVVNLLCLFAILMNKMHFSSACVSEVGCCLVSV